MVGVDFVLGEEGALCCVGVDVGVEVETEEFSRWAVPWGKGTYVVPRPLAKDAQMCVSDFLFAPSRLIITLSLVPPAWPWMMLDHSHLDETVTQRFVFAVRVFPCFW